VPHCPPLTPHYVMRMKGLGCTHIHTCTHAHIHMQAAELFVQNLRLYLTGKPLKYIVDWDKGY